MLRQKHRKPVLVALYDNKRHPVMKRSSLILQPRSPHGAEGEGKSYFNDTHWISRHATRTVYSRYAPDHSL